MRAQHTSPIQAPPVVSPTTQLRLFRLELRLPLNVVVPQYPLLDSIYKLSTHLQNTSLHHTFWSLQHSCRFPALHERYFMATYLMSASSSILMIYSFIPTS